MDGRLPVSPSVEGLDALDQACRPTRVNAVSDLLAALTRRLCRFPRAARRALGKEGKPHTDGGDGEAGEATYYRSDIHGTP